ncbi:hypothetical protein EDB80DRAFT_248727 [Ilyonectria destructans]|nr:hypothetical protein EDB80DRAFT_248727 [Ilyonectria destructans]
MPKIVIIGIATMHEAFAETVTMMSEPKSQDASKASSHHRTISSWLSTELDSIRSSTLELLGRLSTHPGTGPKSGESKLKVCCRDIGEAGISVTNSLHGARTKRSGPTYAPLVVDLEFLKSKLSELGENLKELLGSRQNISSKKLALRHVLGRPQLLKYTNVTAMVTAQVPASVKALQEKVQAVQQSLSLVLASMEITAALEQTHSDEVRDLQMNLQRLANRGNDPQYTK